MLKSHSELPNCHYILDLVYFKYQIHYLYVITKQLLNIVLMDKLTKFINAYKPEELTFITRLEPILPEYIPSIGEFSDLKVDPPQKINRKEPTTKPLNNAILQYQLKNKMKSVKIQSHFASDAREVSQFVEDSKHLANNSSIVTSCNIPEEEVLMSAWNRDVDHFLSITPLLLENDMDLKELCDLSLSLLGIPYNESDRSRIEGLNALFNLYHNFNSSDHFK